MTPRRFLTFIAVMSTAALSSEALAKEDGTATGVSIARVFTGWRDDGSFKRISEYFSGKENTGGEIVLRTQPGQRGGYYFLVRAANPGAPLAITANLEVITGANAKPVNYTFPTELKSGATVLNLGLTGSDWTGAKVNPVAWKLDLVDTDGRILATQKSYLWEKPAAK
jgi:hypothetical protein